MNMIAGALGRVLLARPSASALIKNLNCRCLPHHRPLCTSSFPTPADTIPVSEKKSGTLTAANLLSFTSCKAGEPPVCNLLEPKDPLPFVGEGMKEEDPDSDSDFLLEGQEPFVRPRYNSLTVPLVQIFSVCIHTDFELGDEQSEIYGSIQAIEECGLISKLYDRDRAYPEPIFKQGSNLSLVTPPNGKAKFIVCDLHSNTTLDLDLYLKHKTRGDIVLVKGKHILHSKTQEIEDSYDKLMNAIVPGDHGFLSVYYTIFRFGVVATVALKLIDKHDTACRSTVEVYGNVKAGYAKAHKYYNGNSNSNSNNNVVEEDDETKYMKTTLFDKTADQPVLASLNKHFGLSRCVVAVPAYFTLLIDLQLWDSRGQFASGSVEFPACGRGEFEETIHGENGNIIVEVSWGNAYIRLYENDDIGCTQVATSEEDVGESRGLFPFRGKRLFTTMSREWPDWGTSMIEVFSVYVDGVSHVVTALCGEIIMYTYKREAIFQKDLSNLELLPAKKSMTFVNCDFACDDLDFAMVLYLKDPLLDIEVCNGHMLWSPYCYEELCNERLCSVIPGDHGYAAVYFTIFDNACQAIMTLTFSSDYPPDVSADISGCVVARYDDDYEDYSSSYDKKYYQSRLFDVARAESIKIAINTEIPLIKYIVAAPVDSSLIIEADLRAVTNQGEEVIIYGMAEFKVHLSETCQKEIRGGHLCIGVSVKFEEA